MVDYYDILNIDTTASERDIKVAFRKMAKKYHPDVNDHQDAPEKFKKVYMAYEVLSDPFKKRLYDEIHQNAMAGESGANQSSFNYDAGFDEWEYRAAERADHYANMRYKQFEKQELKGLDFVYHQVALLLGIVGLFAMGGGALYFAKTIITAYMAGKTPASSLIGAVVLGIFGLFILYYVNQMIKVFAQTFLKKLTK
ncbi:DnaJ domain-containing protein [bacterium]|nr:DnaJ domain-containing protein [bacterium]